MKIGHLIVLLFAVGWGGILYGLSRAFDRPDVVWPIGVGVPLVIAAVALLLGTLREQSDQDEIAEHMAQAAAKVTKVPRSAR